MKTAETEKANAQKAYCDRNKKPYFAPGDGVCYDCGNNIYSDVTHNNGYVTKGRSLEYASSQLITGCQHCNISYCE